MTNKPVSATSFTHFGYSKVLRSQPTYYSIKALARANMLEDVFVLDVEQTYDLDPGLFDVPIPGGKTIPRAFYLTESVVVRWKSDLPQDQSPKLRRLSIKL